MKYIYFLFLFVLSLCTANITSAQLYLGANGGFPATAILNQNNYGFQEPDYKLTFGPSFGGVVGYQLSYSIGVQVNVNYVKQGQHYKDSFYNGDLIKQVNLDYIQIPILFEWLPGASPSLIYLPSRAPQFYMNMGVQYGILQTAEVVQEWTGSPDDAPFLPEDAKQLYTSTDISAVVEHGFQYFFNQQFFINYGIRCVVGLTDINKSEFHIPVHFNNPLPTESYKESRNGVFGVNFTVAYLFGKSL